MTKILLIEDNPGDACLVQNVLSKAAWTCDVEHVSQLADALRRSDLESFDVILTNLSLPDSSGLQSAVTLRRRLPHIPLIVLTSSENHDLALRALDLGAQDYLIKDGINIDILQRSIYYAVQRQLVLRENIKLLSRLKKSKHSLKRKNRRLTRHYQTAQQFVDNVSHEFRTPLTVIKEYSGLISDGLAGGVNEEQQRMLNVITDCAGDLNTMVDDMLDMSKLKAGLLGAWRKPWSVVEVIRRVMPMLKHKAQLRNVLLETMFDEHLPLVYCDGEKLGRVIINLVVNAIKFCGKSGIVQLCAKGNPQAKEVVVGVTDNGPGIAEEHLGAIFKRFKQLDADDDRNTKGFGLGLNIAKKLVELNLGTMSVESKIGQGSTFSFSVPWAEPVEVTGRYLSQIAAQCHKSPIVSLVNAELDESADESQCNEIDAFLSYQLRHNDVLFCAGQRCRLILLLTPACELGQFIERFTTARLAANCNRPHGPLPEIRYDIKGSWRVVKDRNEILSQVLEYCSASEVCCG